MAQLEVWVGEQQQQQQGQGQGQQRKRVMARAGKRWEMGRQKWQQERRRLLKLLVAVTMGAQKKAGRGTVLTPRKPAAVHLLPQYL